MRIDVFHDTVCPWCRIGKANLRLALQEWTGGPVEVGFHAFFLNPDIPEEGYDFAEYMTAKGGGQVPLEQWFARPRELGAKAGLTFSFESISRAPNSTRSHELIALAPEDRREQIIDALYDAYFEHGRDIGDPEVLLAVAEEQGVSDEGVIEGLRDRRMRDRVLAENEEAHKLGVTGVPFFVFERSYGLSGAHPPKSLLEVMKKSLEEHARS
jgi:predicted DsbA family dithiol-disulfide isomerase